MGTTGQEMPRRSLKDTVLLALDVLRTNGIRQTWRKARAHVGSAWFDLRYGVRSNQMVAMTDLTVVGKNKAHGTYHQAIKPLTFDAAMDAFEIPPEGGFVDFGSGTGRALMLAVLGGFRRVVGVEYASNLCPLAESNLATFRRRTGRDFDVRIVNIDAGDYQVDERDSVFFLYNPFGRPVLERVLANIWDSYESAPRPIHVVYGNPTQRDVLDGDPSWSLVGETGGDGLEKFIHYQPRSST